MLGGKSRAVCSAAGGSKGAAALKYRRRRESRMRKTYKIGEVANILGVSADTIRYYEKAGIVYSKRTRPTDTGTLPRRISTRC